MKSLLEGYSDPALVRKVVKSISKMASEAGYPRMTFMEVCGTHTMAISRSGLRSLLPPCIKLLSGPGCPVCVTPLWYVDAVLELARDIKRTIVTFGDMVRVPGSRSSLQRERAAGADVRVVYSPAEAIKLAESCPNRQVVMVAVGFETTAPAVAWVVRETKAKGIRNLLVFSGHKLIPPALRALLDSKEVRIDGFICPGHVSVIIGSGAYQDIARSYRVPCVVGGFEPLDVVITIEMLFRQLLEGRSAVEVEYKRAVAPSGNRAALAAIEEVFEPRESEWRGMGAIPLSGLGLRKEFADFDAEKVVRIKPGGPQENLGCRCGAILRGALEPEDCPLFGKDCTPDHAVGPCMVSVEGACASHYAYRGRRASGR